MSSLPHPTRYSGRLARKGVLVEETYRVFAHWDLGLSLRENISRIRATNPIGATNQAWLREVTATLSNRFSSGDPVGPLVTLAKGGLPMDTWKFCLLWHLGSTDGLYADFATGFLFPKLEQEVAVFTTDDVLPFVHDLVARDAFGQPLSEYGVRRLARDLLRMACEFGLLRGTSRREVAHPAIPDDAILYALHDLQGTASSVHQIIDSARWRLFLLGPAQVEQDVLHLHQFRRLHYQRAGSIRELSLPHANLMAFAQSLVA